MNPADEIARLEAENRRLRTLLDASAGVQPRGGALARSYEELHAQMVLAIELADIAIWRHDLAAGRMYYSDEAYRVLQMTPRPDGLPLAEVRALIHPDDLPHVEESAKVALATGGPTDMEARYRRADGRWRSVMTRRVLQRDADGKPAAFIGVALDVTDRIDASRRAADLGRRLELTTRTAGIGYWHQEGNGERAFWSDEMRRIHGLPDGAPVPTTREWLERFVHPEDREEHKRAFVRWLRGDGATSVSSDLRLVRPDGGVRHVITHSTIEQRGADPKTFGLVIDVTERRRVEGALRDASERSALAARSIGLGTWEHDPRHGVVFWDAQMWRLRGLEPQQRPPTNDEVLGILHPDDRARMEHTITVDYPQDEPVSHEFRVIHPGGAVRWLASRSTLVRGDGGAPRRVGVNWDITDARTAEAVRREREIARRESQAKSKFLARMSHELRTPLNGVLGFAQLLLADDFGNDAKARARKRRVEQIHGAGQHLLSLINDVLDLSSLEGGELRIQLEPVALAPLAAETIALVEPLRARHEVTLAPGALEGYVLADTRRLRQVLLNLLSNAIKYNRPGGTVTIEATREDAGVRLLVADNGRGMSDEQLAGLFEPFNRLGVEREDIEGTGIGLAIVKALVDSMGGSVQVSSQAGVGTRFELLLRDAGAPRPAPAPVVPQAATPRPAAARQATILYVEDNPINALIIRELVGRRPDIALHVAPDGTSGVAQAQALRPDLVLLDMQLPDFDGHEVLRRLRADATTERIPVIAVSANAMPDDIQRALSAGMADYWTKPLDFGAFMNALDRMFGPAPVA
jgi:PAS domain S-box-containing protein